MVSTICLQCVHAYFYILYRSDSQHRFLRETISAIFDLQVIYIRPTKFRVICILVQEKEFKIDFQGGRYGRHLGFPICTFLAILI